jgi:hypothetical protein
MTDAEKLTALRAESRKLRQCRKEVIEAFERYGHHDLNCLSQANQGVCNCGYEAVNTVVQDWKKPILKRKGES